MPANRAAIERHYTQPPDDERGETCDVCEGSGLLLELQIFGGAEWVDCSTCHGTGRIDPVDAAEALGERWADDQYEASIDWFRELTPEEVEKWK